MHNEYLARFLELGGDDWNNLEGGFSARREMVIDYAWAVPNDEALDALVDLGPLVEVGAGGGYWAGLLRARGVSVAAYDSTPPGAGTENVQARRLWSPVLRAPTSISRRHADRTLLLCWPPYATSMAFSALYGYLRHGGKMFAFIGESRGGCTGDDAFFDLLYERMEEVTRHAIPQWIGIHDELTIYQAKAG